MNNFNIGDIVVAKDDYYGITNKKSGWTGIVTEILMEDRDEQLFSAKSITPMRMFGEPYLGLSSDHFDVLCSTNRNIVKVGDKVRVKGLAGIAQSANKSFDKMYLGKDGIYFNKEMRILCDRECEVFKIVRAGSGLDVRTYALQDSLSGIKFPYNYSEWMFTKEEEQDD